MGSDGGQTGVRPWSDPRLTPAAQARTVIVLDFANVTGDADIAWLSAGIAETVTSGLRAMGTLRVMDRVPLLPGTHDAVAGVADRFARRHHRIEHRQPVAAQHLERAAGQHSAHPHPRAVHAACRGRPG